MRLLIIMILCVPCSLTAQIKVSLGAGYGTYAMDDLKKFQQSIVSVYPVQMKSASSFPGFINFEGAASVDINGTNFFGLVAGFGSTGARSSYADYSGSVQVDQLVHYISLNATIGFKKKFASGNSELSLDLRPGITWTNLEMNATTVIGGTSDNTQFKFTSHNFVAQPTLGFSRKLTFFSIFATAGYNVAIDLGKMDQHDGSKTTATTLKADWSGLRFGVGVSAYVGKK